MSILKDEVLDNIRFSNNEIAISEGLDEYIHYDIDLTEDDEKTPYSL